jgi:geranylgeranyl diphosphate synthase, type I
MARLTDYLSALELEMRRLVASEPSPAPLPNQGRGPAAAEAASPSPYDMQAQLYGMLRYHLGWVDEAFEPVTLDAGKRIRPLMLLFATQAQGGDWTQALPAAAAVELLHNFTLIHDDIEDRDETRRGRPTLWALWGIPQAINAGDALYAISYRGLISLQARDVPAQRALAALDRFTEVVISITEGQCLDLAFESQAGIEEATYLAMIGGKTAKLLGLAAELGGIIAGAPEPRLAALRAFGEALGMAFQMSDDILGLWGDPQQTGKPIGSDIRRGKKTLPIIHGVRSSDTLVALLSRDDLSDGDVSQALSELTRLGSRDYTEAQAARYHAQALEALEQTEGSGPTQEALRALAQRLLNRDR